MVHDPINPATSNVEMIPQGVEVRATPATPRAHCTDCRWNDTSAECHKRAARHAVDARHVTVVAIVGNVTFTPKPNQPKASK